MGERITKELALACLSQAQTHRGNPTGVMIHSDRGSQYCSKDYQAKLAKAGFICSMSRKGNCWDNSPMESFWGKMKQEWLNGKRFRTREDAKREIFWYIEVYYKRHRLHASNDYLTPHAYRAATNF
jgi:putative transposase